MTGQHVFHRGGVLVPHYYKQDARHPTPKPWSKTKKKKRPSRPDKRERIKRLENTPEVPQLFQNNPAEAAIGFPASGWTRTVEGYLKSARQRKKAVIRNNRMTGQRFTRLCNINLLEPRHPALINRDFSIFVKHLEAYGLVGHWTIQINRRNVVHWHILFVGCHLKPESLKRLVKSCLDAVPTFPRNRVYTNRVRSQGQILDYVLQVEKKGYGVAVENQKTRMVKWTLRKDIYKNDRILFVSKTGLHKNGTIGRFWAEGFNEKKVWSLICNETATVEKNYLHPKVSAYVHWLSKYLGIPLSWARWNIALNPPADLLVEMFAAPRDPRKSLRNLKNYRSRGLVGDIFRHRRHRVPVLGTGNAAPPVHPSSTPKTGRRNHMPNGSAGVLRDTKVGAGVVGLSQATPLLQRGIPSMCGLFRNEESAIRAEKTLESGP